MFTKLREAWRSWSERRRQYRIERAVYKMSGGGKQAWSQARGKYVVPAGPLAPHVPTEGTTRWNEALQKDDQEDTEHGSRTGGKRKP